MKRFKNPFTLVELLCVIIVILLLAAISIRVSQIVYPRAEETRTESAIEIIRAANEQYKAKYGYYLPNSKCAASGNENYYKIQFYTEKGGKKEPTEFGALLGDSFEYFLNMPCDDNGNETYLRDAWGKEIRYSCPGVYNTGSFDLYSKGRDLTSGDADKSVHTPGDGDDIANFKNPTER